ncbi:MAG TPA: YraN family protein [Chloroflexota bacterium]|jgi:putative endonuclease|nr:YraN family protein [Chloroflexota bacterium]
MSALNQSAHARGAAAEAYAARHLVRAGYAILARNYRGGGGEIDLVAQQGDEVVFVEVRARQPGGLVSPEESLTARKRERILCAAAHYLQHTTSTEPPWRVDLIAIEIDVRGTPGRLTHLCHVLP